MYQTSLAHQRPSGLTAEEIAYVLERRGLGYPDQAIARMLGRSLALVQGINQPKPEVVPAPVDDSVVILGPPKMMEIAREVAARHGLTLADLQSNKLLGDRYTHPRQEVYQRLILAGFSGVRIGQFMGGRDHSTVFKGAKAHHARYGS